MPLLRQTLSFALCLLLVPIGADAFECQSSISESGNRIVSVTTDSDSAISQILIAYAGDGVVDLYEIGGVFLFDDWKVLGNEAYDVDGKRFEEVIARQELTTAESVIESVRIRIDRIYLEEHVSTGIGVTVHGENSDMDMSIPPEMISAFFECLEPGK